MPDISSSAGQTPHQQVHVKLPSDVNVKKVDVYNKGTKDGQPDFLIVVWLAFYSQLSTNEQTAQVHSLQLEHTQKQEGQTNDVLASYDYSNISEKDMSSSWNPEFAKVSETNDRVQAEISITQNQVGVETQTAQTQSTNANTAIQDSTQSMQLGVGMAKEIKQITDVIITI